MISPQGSILTLSASSYGYNSLSCFIEDVQYTFSSEPFQRLEYSNQFLKDKLNPSGSQQVYLTAFLGVPVQLNSTCDPALVRNLAADDANIDLINRKWIKKIYTFKGGPTSNTVVSGLFQLAQQHKLLLDQFTLYQQTLQQPFSYDYFYNTVRAFTFSYLSSTAVSMTGNIFSNNTIWNVLLNNFNEGVVYEKEAADGTSEVLIKDWGFTAEVRQNVPASSTTPIFNSY